jgi:hypothetical protein
VCQCPLHEQSHLFWCPELCRWQPTSPRPLPILQAPNNRPESRNRIA